MSIPDLTLLLNVVIGFVHSMLAYYSERSAIPSHTKLHTA